LKQGEINSVLLNVVPYAGYLHTEKMCNVNALSYVCILVASYLDEVMILYIILLINNK